MDITTIHLPRTSPGDTDASEEKQQVYYDAKTWVDWVRLGDL